MTGYERRIRDWSSDVCSSDLIEAVGEDDGFLHRIFTALPPPVHEFRSGLDRLFAVRSRPLPPTDPVGSVFEKLGGAEGVGKRDAQIIAIGVLPVLEHLIGRIAQVVRSEEHTSELQSLMRISYAVYCLKKKN